MFLSTGGNKWCSLRRSVSSFPGRSDVYCVGVRTDIADGRAHAGIQQHLLIGCHLA